MKSKTYEYHIKAIDRLYFESLHPFVSRVELQNRMEQICDNHEATWRSEDVFKVNTNEDNKKHNILAVNERIRLTEIIYPKSKRKWESAYHIPPLCEYLLLTGFDILGQKYGWLSFSNWLEAKKKKTERENTLKDIPLTLSPEEYSKAAYKVYESIYGVTNSFFNFFNLLITPEQRERFLSSIEIEIYENYPKNLSNWELGTETDKLKFLFKVRNAFTHNCEPTNHHNLLWSHHLDKEGWFRKAEFLDKGKNFVVKVKANFYSELKWILRTGIWEYVKKNSDKPQELDYSFLEFYPMVNRKSKIRDWWKSLSFKLGLKVL